MPDRFILTQNAQFYTPKSGLNDEMIESLLEEASNNMEPDGVFVLNLIREERQVRFPEFSYTYSARVFPSERQVYFFDDDIKDKIYAFILIFEIDGHVAILKKSCANISECLKQYFNKINHLEMISTFDDDEVDFQKISLRNMTISDRALRSKSYEAADLKGLMSTHAAGRSIPFYMKIREGSKIRTITTNTGRMVESSNRKPIDRVAIWLKKQIDLLNQPNTNKPFLSSFAKLVELPDVLQVTRPKAILIEGSSLFERLEKEGLPLQYKMTNNKTINVSQRVKEKTYHFLEKVYELDDKGNALDPKVRSRVRINNNTITFTSQPLRKLRTVENGKTITLQRYIIKNGFYSICFENPKFMYFMNNCFEDSSGISEIDSILEILFPKNEIIQAQSEKGEIEGESIRFDRKSLFGIIENIHNADDYIFCDDLGIEWADHITFNKAESCINFIHSKHGEETTSASKLHDVVGQGIKNLGNMIFSKRDFLKKYQSKFNTTYSNSQIQRTRKRDQGELDDYIDSLLSDYKLHRKCILNCSFISKSAIEQAFQNIKNNTNVTGHSIQLMWIISSFAHAAKDMNIIPIIYCCP